MFLGENLIVYLVMALGGALAVGNIAAIVRPPSKPRKPGRPDNERDNDEGDGPAEEESTDLAKAPIARSLFMAIIGATAAVWAIASLVS